MARKRKNKKPKKSQRPKCRYDRDVEKYKTGRNANTPKGTSIDKQPKWSPVDKPGDDLMPLCTTCKTRPVSDARRGECGRCSITYHGQSFSVNEDIRKVERMFDGH